MRLARLARRVRLARVRSGEDGKLGKLGELGEDGEDGFGFIVVQGLGMRDKEGIHSSGLSFAVFDSMDRE